LESEIVGVFANTVLVGVEVRDISSLERVGVCDNFVGLTMCVMLPTVKVPTLRVLDVSLEGDIVAEIDAVANVCVILRVLDREGEKLSVVLLDVSFTERDRDMDRASGEKEADGDATDRELEADSVNAPVSVIDPDCDEVDVPDDEASREIVMREMVPLAIVLVTSLLLEMVMVVVTRVRVKASDSEVEGEGLLEGVRLAVSSGVGDSNVIDAGALMVELLLAPFDSVVLHVDEPMLVTLGVEDSVKLGTMDRVGVTYGT
jgi:hypothetical protein